MDKFLKWMNEKKVRLVFVALAIFILGAAVSQCANAAGAFSDDVSWELPTQRVDGTPLPASEIANIQIRVQRDGVDVALNEYPPSILAMTFDRDLPPNYTLCYAGKTIDTTGLESEWSAEVCKIVRGNPNPPKVNNPK